MTLLNASLSRLCRTAALLLAGIAGPAPAARAVILIQGADGRNLSAPTGDLALSGWQYEGYWGGVLGTPIAPHFFIAAKHAGGPADGIFQALDGSGDHHAIASFTLPGSDIALYEVAEPFTAYAPLYTGSDETLLGDAVIYGAGTQRGGPVLVNSAQQGWYWGDADFQRSWGTNAVRAIADGGPSLGDLLLFSIDQDGGPNEGAISAWDSGGGEFVNVGGTWELAGINYGVESYSADGGASSFFAALWDTRGLSVQGDSGWQYVDPSLPAPQPGTFAGTRLSSQMPFIQSVIGADLPGAAAPEPGTLALALCGGVVGIRALLRRRRGGEGGS